MTRTSKKTPAAALRTRESSNARGGIAKATAASKCHSTTPTVAPNAPNKQQQLAALIIREEGATLDQMIAATGWLPHTARAALTGLKKKGYVISSDKMDGVRTYRAVAPE